MASKTNSLEKDQAQKPMSEKPKQHRGFACMSEEQRFSICRMGGRKTARKYGRKYMSKIGRRGRAKRTRNEQAAKVA